MSRHVSVTVQSLGLILGLVGVAAAQDPPPLEAPSLEGPKAEAGASASPAPAPAATDGAAARSNPAGKPASAGLVRNGPARPATGAPATPRVVSQPVRPETRPMLAIPGVTAPAAHPSRSIQPPAARSSGPSASPAVDALPRSVLGAPSLGAADADAPLPLDGPPLPEPIEVAPPRGGFAPSAGNADRALTPSPSGPVTRNLGEPIPLTIEPMDGDPSTTGRSPSARPGTARPGTPSSRDRAGLEDVDRVRDRARSSMAPRGRGGLLGRFFSQPAPLPPPRERDEVQNDASKAERDLPADRDRDRDRDRDPEAAARRRIERQIHETLGEKLRWYEVRMTGRNVVIVAQPSRFWLRRSVRNTLENLPVLQGYRSRIEIRD